MKFVSVDSFKNTKRGILERMIDYIPLKAPIYPKVFSGNEKRKIEQFEEEMLISLINFRRVISIVTE